MFHGKEGQSLSSLPLRPCSGIDEDENQKEREREREDEGGLCKKL
jgi:hypothetical protein